MTEFQVKVHALRKEFPKCTPTAVSLAQRSVETGVMFTPLAQAIVDGVERATRPYKRHSSKRVKSVRFMCRLSPDAAEFVKQQMAERHVSTTQTLMENLLIEWATKKPRSVRDCEARGAGMDSADSTPNHNTNL